MFDVRALLTDHGVQRGEMFADTAYVFDDQTRFELRKVRATFNTSTGTKDGVMSGDRGRYSTRDQMLEGFGNVVIVTNEGRRLTSPHIKYMQAANEVSSDTTFTLVEPGRDVERHRIHAPIRSSRACACCAPGRARAASRFPASDCASLVGALALLLVATAAAGAGRRRHRSGRCAFDLDRPTGRAHAIKLPSGQRNIYIGGDVVARGARHSSSCSSRTASSTYGDEGRVVLHRPRRLHRAAPHAHAPTSSPISSARSACSRRSTSTRSSRAARTSRVRSLEFWRAIPKVREQHATAIGRPTITIIEKDSAGRPQPPVTVTGNNVWMMGDSTVASQGEVVVVRPELTASGDSLFLDGGTGLASHDAKAARPRHARPPVHARRRDDRRAVEGAQARPRARQVEGGGGQPRRERSSRTRSTSGSPTTSCSAPSRGEPLARTPSPRASRCSPIRWTSLMPNQRLQEMHAVGGAVTEGAPDSVKFRTPERDRLTGDTIVAHFDTAASQVRDTTSKPKIRLLVSTGHATSLQHLPPRDTTLRVPAIVLRRRQPDHRQLRLGRRAARSR